MMQDQAVLIPAQIWAELSPLAEQEHRCIEDLVNEALRRYVWEARERKIEQELEAYCAMHAELVTRYLGQYVAIHNGNLVGNDVDRAALSRRVRQKYGNAAVLITQVEREPEREFTWHSPRFERGE